MPSSSSKLSAWQRSESIRKQSRHIYHKLASLSTDARFVRTVAEEWFPSLPVVANLRCGAWYTDPLITSAVSYFKSTDGHTHQWSFSLKRSNLHLMALIQACQGCIIVDSTRRGKSMSDAQSKTIPIWCAVLNQASFQKYGTPCIPLNHLVTPDWMIPPSEHDQIRQRITSFVEAFLDSDLEIPKLSHALRPVFITPQTTDTQQLPDVTALLQKGEIPIILVSASKWIDSSESVYELQQRLEHFDIGKSSDSKKDNSSSPASSFLYVQGAGDDHENWARGLTPNLFWSNSLILLSTSIEQIESVVDQLVTTTSTTSTSTRGAVEWFHPSKPFPSSDLLLNHHNHMISTDEPVCIANTRIHIATLPIDYVFSLIDLEKYCLIIHCSSPPTPTESESRILRLGLSESSKGLSSIPVLFPKTIKTATTCLLNEQQKPLLICCHSTINLSISLTIALLATLYNDDKLFLSDENLRSEFIKKRTKQTVHKRLQWVVSTSPTFTPSRAFLLRVNQVLLSDRFKPIPPDTC